LRIIAVSSEGILDTDTGEISPRLELEKLLSSRPGGIIAGRSLYPVICELIPETLKDEGWTVSISVQQQRVNPLNRNEKRVTGMTYVTRLTYRPAKVGGRRNRRRPPSIKWLVLNLDLFFDTSKIQVKTSQQVLEAAKSLIELGERRGVKPRHSPGAYGSALLRASSEWNTSERPAPFFISDIAREHLPGNYYALAPKVNSKPLEHVYYMDQASSHHKISSSIPLPHPHWLRARGRLRAVEDGQFPCWIPADRIGMLRRQVGLLCCTVECGVIPHRMTHLYPPWMRERGKQIRWIWTPELRLLDKRVLLRHVSCALTSHHIDTALWEYAEWALEQNKREDKSVLKSSLLAAYGMLACRTDRPIELYTVHGRAQPPRSEVCQLPLLPKVYRSTVQSKRVPSIQNVIARGVIEAETRTRSIEYARQLEGEGIPVAQIYADGLLAVTDQMPLMLPEHWRIAASLTRVTSPHPNSIISDQLTRLPGIERAGREAYTMDGRVSREREPNLNVF
jgi:hypothetical protein